MRITTPTTSQSLGTLLKSARYIMRKDKGLNVGQSEMPKQLHDKMRP